MNLTDKFKVNYLKGFDCRLATFRNNLACSDIVMSNAMALGLSGSFIFCCNNAQIFNTHSIPIIAGISDQTLEGLSCNTGAYIFRSVFCIDDNWVDEIDMYLTQGIPINVAVNRGKLQEIRQPNEPMNPFIANMGFHYISITGYDRESNTFTIFETDSSNEIYISSDELKEVWFYDVLYPRKKRDFLQSCNGQWYGILVRPMNDEILVSSAINAIQRVLLNFYHSPYRNQLGITAIDVFEKEAYTWHLPIKTPEKMASTIKFLNLMCNSLSGGGMGRKLYGYFLSEISLKLNDDSLREIANSFHHSAKLWRIFVSKLNETVKFEKNSCAVDFAFIKNIIDEYLPQIIDSEKAQMAQLKEWAETKRI